MQSTLYRGKLCNRRFSPREHQFTYPVFIAFLDIDELPRLMRVSPTFGLAAAIHCERPKVWVKSVPFCMQQQRLARQGAAISKGQFQG